MATIADDELKINFPEWTEYRKKNGLDPLGMQNSSVNLYQTFLPGISNVTLRMRYYGLYAWLARVYLKEYGDTNPESWKRFVRRAEALYALIAHAHGNESGVAGIEWAQRTYDAASDEPIDFGTDAEPGSETYYLKQSWGAYGAAYSSQLFEIGIYTSGQGHDLPLPSEEIGDSLAAAFEIMLGDNGPKVIELIDRGTVSKAELDALATLSPSEIKTDSEERSLYQQVLLRADETDEASAISRRLSLTLIMKIAALLKREPKPDEIRWILYAGFDQKGTPLVAGNDALEAQRLRWWVYHANDLSHIAMECLLKFTLDLLASYPLGIPLARLLPICTEQILEAAGGEPNSWQAFLDGITSAPNAYASDNPDSDYMLAQTVIRGAGRSDASFCAPETAWAAIKLLATVHKRLRTEDHDIAAELGHFDPDWFRSLLTETRFLDQQIEAPFAEMIARLLEERVIRRHLWVALRKFRHQGDYTFLIETDEGRVRLREKDGPVFTNPRLGPAITFLRDIHLIGGQGLTDFGAEAAGDA